MSHFATGRQAESAAVAYLETHGYRVLAQNWRTRWCEIDIVAKKKAAIHFVEVKYREHTGQGRGLEYITQSKLKRMELAALSWVQQNEWEGDYNLGVLEITGPAFQVTVFLPDCS